MSNMSKPDVHLWSLGGTISMTRSGSQDGVSPSQTADHFAAQQMFQDVHVHAHAFRAVGSANLAISDLSDLASAITATPDMAHIVTQGTDTMEEVAFVLSQMHMPGKTVVVTGAMRPASDVGADGPRNLQDALTAVRALPAGVYVVMAGDIFDPRSVFKGHRQHIAAFQAPDGPIGSVTDAGCHMRHRLATTLDIDPVQLSSGAANIGLWYAGLDMPAETILHAANDMDGLVIASFGGGHLSEAQADVAADLAATLPVILSSRIESGIILQSTYGYRGAEIDTLGRGLVWSGDLSAVKARLALAIALKAAPTGKAPGMDADWRSLFARLVDMHRKD